MFQNLRVAALARVHPGTAFRHFCLLALRLGLALAALLPAGAYAAIEPQLHHTAWTLKDGAPADIWAIAQGDDGYLWLGTGNGLYRFDGVGFERYAARGQALPSNNISALLTTPNGDLWMGLFLGGVAVLRHGEITVYDAAQGAPSDTVFRLQQDASGAIWAASYRGLERYDGQRWEHIGTQWNYPAARADWVHQDSQGFLWVTTGEELLMLRPRARVFERTGIRVDDNAVVTEAPDHTIWLSDGLNGTRALPDIRTQPAGAPPASVAAREPLQAVRLMVDRAGTLWGTDRVNGGAYRLAANATQADGRSLERSAVLPFMKADGLTSDMAVPIFEDREGNVWIGSNLGLNRFRYNNVTMFKDPLIPRQGVAMVGGDAATGLLLSNDGQVFRRRGGVLGEIASLPTRFLAGVTTDSDDRLLVSGRVGIWRRDGDALRRLPVPQDADPKLISGLVPDDSGGLWVAIIGAGLFHYVGDSWTQWRGDTPLPTANINRLARDRHGVLWVGYTDNRLARVDGSTLRLYTAADGLSLGTITALADVGSAAQPLLLIAGETGVAMLRDGRVQMLHIAPAERLHAVTGIVESTQHELWFNGIRGVVRIASSELDRVAGAPLAELRHQAFEYEDGLGGVALQSVSTQTAAIDDEGRVWFATNQGAAIIDPPAIRHNAVVPPVVIRSLTAGDRRYTAADAIVLPQHTRDLRIDYTAASLSVPERVRFRYRLSGADPQWQEAGDRRQAFYTNLAPGEYRFQVIAANDSGVWNTVGATMRITIQPTFLQTPAFAALCVLAAGGALFLLYLLRLQQVASRVRARLEVRHLERERIARELHDTLLQSVQGLVLHFQAAANRMPKQEPARQALEQALVRADRVIAEGRDRVHELRETAASAQLSLAQAFAQVGEELRDGRAIGFHLRVEGQERAIDPLLRDEVYRIGREALVNAFQHAQARNIEVEISYDSVVTRFRFRDDGRGIDPDILSAGGKPRHWGLAGMRERARSIRAPLTIRSAPGAGTEIELQLPCAPASMLSAFRQRWLQRGRRDR